MSTKHENYEVLNLIGYGLAKFDLAFVSAMGFATKTALYEAMVTHGIAQTVGTVKNRQDLFDPFFPNTRKGWWQKGEAYIHRKHHIDLLFGELPVEEYANVIKLYLRQDFAFAEDDLAVAPLMQTKFRKLQETGLEAEMYFLQHYKQHHVFANGDIEDARLFGDGYDFQISVNGKFLLAEVKGLRSDYGSVRLTEKEFLQAETHGDTYGLVIISNLETTPKMGVVFNPCSQLTLTRQVTTLEYVSYHIASQHW